MNTGFHMALTGAVASMASMPGHTRTRDDDDRLVRTFTRWTLGAALAATAGFGGLAAAATHHAQAATQTDESTGSAASSLDSDSSTLTPSVSAPEQTFSPPVAQSGGS